MLQVSQGLSPRCEASRLYQGVGMVGQGPEGNMYDSLLGGQSAPEKSAGRLLNQFPRIWAVQFYSGVCFSLVWLCFRWPDCAGDVHLNTLESIIWQLSTHPAVVLVAVCQH